MTATVTDLFCGAGGSSTGAAAAGMEIRLAANHWQQAIDVHQINHPDAAHDCADISQVDPRRYPRTDAGNAVTPPVMTWITGRLLQALEAS